jgi:iron-sulfur cluster repair protein YtfE (RIC family)
MVHPARVRVCAHGVASSNEDCIMATNKLDLDCRRSVNDVITRHPMTLAVFSRFGLDTRCDGTLSVRAAAQANAVDAEALCAELHDAARLQWGARQLLKRRCTLHHHVELEPPMH